MASTCALSDGDFRPTTPHRVDGRYRTMPRSGITLSNGRVQRERAWNRLIGGMAGQPGGAVPLGVRCCAAARVCPRCRQYLLGVPRNGGWPSSAGPADRAGFSHMTSQPARQGHEQGV